MRIAVLNNSVPFIRGGAEFLADTLVTELVARGHEAELVKVPLRWDTPLAVAESMVAATSMRIPEADRVIALKFPAYLVPHPSKTVWLLHQFRQVYDLWGTPHQGFPDGPETDALRRAIKRADERAFRESSALLCNSAVTAGRLADHNQMQAGVLLAPHSDVHTFEQGPYENRIVALGRVNSAKRQHLLVDALARTTSSISLTIAGQPETPAEGRAITERIQTLGLEDRVRFIPRFITDAEKVDLLRSAGAAAYLPVDEDSYGYVTAEAMLSGKSVITCRDSGGILELVEHGVTGFVADPDPASIAQAMDQIGHDAVLRERLGKQALERVQTLDLSWDGAIERLLA